LGPRPPRPAVARDAPKPRNPARTRTPDPLIDNGISPEVAARVASAARRARSQVPRAPAVPQPSSVADVILPRGRVDRIGEAGAVGSKPGGLVALGRGLPPTPELVVPTGVRHRAIDPSGRAGMREHLTQRCVQLDRLVKLACGLGSSWSDPTDIRRIAD
jgi:hypothetical protein